MGKLDAHYLRATLVKPLQLPGLEDPSLLWKDQIPHVTALTAKQLVHRFDSASG